MSDTQSSELEQILDTVRWGDFERPDGSDGHGIANRPEIVAAIEKLMVRENLEAYRNLLKLKTNIAVHGGTDSFSAKERVEVITVAALEKWITELKKQIEEKE